MFKIRRGVFETNSSSTHAICITNTKPSKDIPEHILFREGVFGWEFKTLKNLPEKASYLFTAILCFDYGHEEPTELNRLKEILDDLGIRYSFESRGDGYIDHYGSGLRQFIDYILNDSSGETLLRYLLSPESFILTGNDNDKRCEDIVINVPYSHEAMYKDN